MPRCPACDIVLTSSEAAAGNCPVCAKPLGNLAAPAPSFAAEPRSYSKAAAPWEEETPRPGTCDLCAHEQPDTQPRCVRVYGQSISLAGTVKGRWIDVSCRCCGSCFRKARGMNSLMWFFLLGFILSIPLGLLAGLGIASLIDLLGGQANRGLILALAAMIGFFGFLFLVGPMYMSRRIRKTAQAIFQGSATDETFRKAMGIKKWGMWGRITLYPMPDPNRSEFMAWLLGQPHAGKLVDMRTVRETSAVMPE